MTGFFIFALLVSAAASAFMPTRRALRRSVGCFLVIALAVFFTSIGAPKFVGFTFGDPEMLILGSALAMLILVVSCLVRLLLFQRRERGVSAASLPAPGSPARRDGPNDPGSSEEGRFRSGPWAAWLVISACIALSGIYPFVVFGFLPEPIHMIDILVNFAAVYGLFRFVVRKPLHGPLARKFFLAVAAGLCLRAVWVAVAAGSIVFPWRGEPDQYAWAVTLLLNLLSLLTVRALWLYARTGRNVSAADRVVL